MVVNSIHFWFFFITILVLYYLLFQKSAKAQNLVLLIGSYVFYGVAEWRMLPLLLIASVVFYYLGIKISDSASTDQKRASHLTTFGVSISVLMLFYFKYLNFCVDEFAKLLEILGLAINIDTFKIIMPVGISFYIFKLISYIVEVYRGTIQPCRDPVAFGVFIGFFPTLLSGPIDRPAQFLSQIQSARRPSGINFYGGVRRVLWGLFLKCCIADRISGYTDAVFGNYANHNASSILIAAVFYAFEMYADFAGYSEMAIGVSELLGIKVRENFNRPFFSRNINEYWRKWHMSLTSWITDYIYLPLTISFRNMGKWGLYLATFLNVVVIGVWHGANWTYLLFGVYHGLLLVLFVATDKRRKKYEKKYHLSGRVWYECPRKFLTFLTVCFGMLLFQSESLSSFFEIVSRFGSGFGKPYFDLTVCTFSIGFMAVLFFKELKDEKGWNIHFLHSEKAYVRIVSSCLLVLTIILAGELKGGSFIYFQF